MYIHGATVPLRGSHTIRRPVASLRAAQSEVLIRPNLRSRSRLLPVGSTGTTTGMVGPFMRGFACQGGTVYVWRTGEFDRLRSLLDALGTI